MLPIPVKIVDNKEEDFIDSLFDFKSANEDVTISTDWKSSNSDEESYIANFSQKSIVVPMEHAIGESSDNVDAKQNEVFKSDVKPLVESWSSRVIGQAQGSSNNELAMPPTKWQKPSSSREKKRERMRTLYTTTAPLEIISFFYRIGREARELDSSMSLNLPDDTPVPDPLVCERSCVRAISGTGSATYDFVSPYGSQSELSMHKLNVSDQIQILHRSLSWLGQSMSPYTSEPSLLRPTSGIVRTRNPSSISLDEDDIKKLFGGSSELNLSSPMTPKKKSTSIMSHHFRLDSVGENQSMDIYTSLSQLGLRRPQLSNTGSRLRKSPFSKSKRRSRRTMSSDFAFSEANEISQVNVSSIKTPKDAKRYLKHEEKEMHDNDPFMHLLKSHLKHGSSKKLVSRSMQRSRRWRDARRKEKLSRGFGKSDSLVVGALLRAATENYEQIMTSKDSGLKKISKIDENEQLRRSNIVEEKVSFV